MSKKYKIFSGSNTRYLAEKITKHNNLTLSDVKLVKFSDGEFQPQLEESVRDYNVYLIQSLNSPCSNLMELLLMADASKRASAKNITAIIPYMGWSRQDRKDKGRVPISSKLVADMLKTSGIDNILTFDLHAEQIQGFFNMPVTHLSASYIFNPYIKNNLNIDNVIIASPDTGGTKRAKKLAESLNTNMVICYKHRKDDGTIDEIKVIGDVKGKDVIIIDDLIDTAGTITLSAKILKEEGAKSVRCFATHPVLSGKAYENISNSKELDEIVVTDSIKLKNESTLNDNEIGALNKIKVLSLDKMISDSIKVMNKKGSVSGFFSLKK